MRVSPKAKRERIEKVGDRLKVYVKEPAQDGRANKRLIQMLAEYFSVGRLQVSIVKGAGAREKVVQINGDN